MLGAEAMLRVLFTHERNRLLRHSFSKIVFFLRKNIGISQCNSPMALKGEIHRIVSIQTFRKTVLYFFIEKNKRSKTQVTEINKYWKQVTDKVGMVTPHRLNLVSFGQFT